MDNPSAFAAEEYDREILRTVPFYGELYRQIAEAVKLYLPGSPAWLDVGCGTGKTAEAALTRLTPERFVFCDISEEMLGLARSRFDYPWAEFLAADVRELDFREEFDVVTTLLVGHFLPPPERKTALEKCFRALKPGGLFFSAENFAPRGKTCEELYLKRWENFQLEAGRSPEACAEHLARYGKKYFPIGISESLEMLKSCGFKEAEIFALSYMQAAFIAIK